MMKIENLRCIVVDDEAPARDTLCLLLRNYFPEIEVVGVFDNGQEVLNNVGKLAPDMIFLDIQMPGLSGIELAAALPLGNFSVVFTTAHREYALEAIRLSALDYLLKPLGVDELREAVNRASKRLSQANIQERLALVESRLQGIGSQPDRIALPSMEGYEVHDVHNVVRCQGESNYTSVHLVTGKPILVSRTLAEYGDLLGKAGFVRVHQSHLVNLEHVVRYMKGRGGNIEMSDGSVLPVSRERKKLFLDALAMVR